MKRMLGKLREKVGDGMDKWVHFVVSSTSKSLQTTFNRSDYLPRIGASLIETGLSGSNETTVSQSFEKVCELLRNNLSDCSHVLYQVLDAFEKSSMVSSNGSLTPQKTKSNHRRELSPTKPFFSLTSKSSTSSSSRHPTTTSSTSLSTGFHGYLQTALFVKLGNLWKLLVDEVTAVIIDHLKRSKISIQGSFVLLKDLEVLQMTILQEAGWVSNLNSNMEGEILSSLESLREACVFIFMTPQHRIREDVVTRGKSSTIPLSIIYDLLKRRDDYRTHGMRSNWAKEVFDDDNLANSSEAKGTNNNFINTFGSSDSGDEEEKEEDFASLSRMWHREGDEESLKIKTKKFIFKNRMDPSEDNQFQETTHSNQQQKEEDDEEEKSLWSKAKTWWKKK